MDPSTPPSSQRPDLFALATRLSSSSFNGAATDNDYAFLVHSQETLPHKKPPTVDNKQLARQRRKRTG